MKYSLINCYSDNNKGDLGIILSTIKFLKEYDSEAVINGVSTYNYSDPFFFSEHKLLSKDINIYPSIFGELNIGHNKNPLTKLVRFIFDSMRLLLLLIYPFPIFLSKQEKKTFFLLKSSDYIISKGGSFLCDESSFRSKIAFIRLLYIFLLVYRAFPKVKVILLCQSLGPVYGKLGRCILNFVLKRCSYIVLRESLCMEKYDYIHIPKQKRIVINDIAFYLPSQNVENNIAADNNLRVGITIKAVDQNKNMCYQTMMVKAIEYLITEYNASIYIYPHVTIDNDLIASYNVYKKIKDIYKNKIHIYSDNYTSSELKYLYSKMDFMLSTRLHSAIFAMGEKRPAIVIAYHGTKAQGIYHNWGLEDLLITEYSIDLVIASINQVMKNMDFYISILNKQLKRDEDRFRALFRSIFSL